MKSTMTQLLEKGKAEERAEERAEVAKAKFKSEIEQG